MGVKRIQRTDERSPGELARIQAVRERFQRERPTLEQLVTSGEYNEPIPQGAYLELRHLMHALRSERERQGLSLTEVARHAGIDKAALSRLENGRQINPTWNTLWRYALVLNKGLALVLRDVPAVQRSPAQEAPEPGLGKDAGSRANSLPKRHHAKKSGGSGEAD
jgi:transcriptional regulator with XRE-family HTH domain